MCPIQEVDCSLMALQLTKSTSHTHTNIHTYARKGVTLKTYISLHSQTYCLSEEIAQLLTDATYMFVDVLDALLFAEDLNKDQLLRLSQLTYLSDVASGGKSTD